jgi:GNAT superfamily N-acetyltransferase
MNIRRLTHADLPRLCEFWKAHWGAEFVVAHGIVYRPEMLEGFIVEQGDEWIGEITYTFSGSDCEIVSLDSLREGQGVGTNLINTVADEALKMNCKRLWLITTNDNLHALGFYQRLGFRLVKINRHALDVTRKLKPNIPLIGMNNIPLRDEIELELVFRQIDS